MITYTYDLDVTPGGVPLSVHASQYDGDSRTFVFRLFSSAGELSLPSAAEASVKGTKPDGNGFSYTAERSGNNVTVQLTKQMTAVAGHVRCEIVINLGETELATANFILVVERAALDKDTLIQQPIPVRFPLVMFRSVTYRKRCISSWMEMRLGVPSPRFPAGSSLLRSRSRPTGHTRSLAISTL